MKNLTKNKYKGIRTCYVNEIAWHIYGYKYLSNLNSFSYLLNVALADLQDVIRYDYIIPIHPNNSGSDLVLRLAENIADNKNIQYCNILSNTNRSVIARIDMQGANVLIIDDVYTTGKTAQKAYNAIKKLNPKRVDFYALAQAKK